jgi:hypothetical protein
VPKHKPKVKASVPKKVISPSKIDIDKLTKTYRTIREAQSNLERLNTPRPVVIPGPPEQELKSLAIKMGFDPQKIEQTEADRQKIISRVIEERQAESIKQSASVRKQLNSAAAAVLGGINNVATLGPVKRYLVNEPLAISPTANLEFEGSTISPGNSLAKFQIHAVDLGYSSGIATVDYYFRWQNPSNYGTLISADGLLLVNGTARAATIGGWGTMNHYSELEIFAVLYVSGYWNSYESLGSGEAAAAYLDVDTQANSPLSFYQHSLVQTSNVLKFLDVQASGPMAVPPNGVVSLDIRFTIRFLSYSGSIGAVFGPDPFGVMSPGVIVTKWV